MTFIVWVFILGLVCKCSICKSSNDELHDENNQEASKLTGFLYDDESYSYSYFPPAQPPMKPVVAEYRPVPHSTNQPRGKNRRPSYQESQRKYPVEQSKSVIMVSPLRMRTPQYGRSVYSTAPEYSRSDYPESDYPQSNSKDLFHPERDPSHPERLERVTSYPEPDKKYQTPGGQPLKPKSQLSHQKPQQPSPKQKHRQRQRQQQPQPQHPRPESETLNLSYRRLLQLYSELASKHQESVDSYPSEPVNTNTAASAASYQKSKHPKSKLYRKPPQAKPQPSQQKDQTPHTKPQPVHTTPQPLYQTSATLDPSYLRLLYSEPIDVNPEPQAQPEPPQSKPDPLYTHVERPHSKPAAPSFQKLPHSKPEPLYLERPHSKPDQEPPHRKPSFLYQEPEPFHVERPHSKPVPPYQELPNRKLTPPYQESPHRKPAPLYQEQPRSKAAPVHRKPESFYPEPPQRNPEPSYSEPLQRKPESSYLEPAYRKPTSEYLEQPHSKAVHRKLPSHLEPSHRRPTSHLEPSHRRPTSHLEPSHRRPTSHLEPPHKRPTSHLEPPHKRPTSYLEPPHRKPAPPYREVPNRKLQHRKPASSHLEPPHTIPAPSFQDPLHRESAPLYPEPEYRKPASLYLEPLHASQLSSPSKQASLNPEQPHPRPTHQVPDVHEARHLSSSHLRNANFEEHEEFYEEVNTRGEPGRDYPIFASIPPTRFTCDDKQAGFYGDPETHCQVWHICDLENRKSSFLCTNGTIYNQIARVCDWWFNVDCGSSANFYSINDDLYKNPGSVIPEEDEDEFEFQTPQQFFF